MLRENGEQGWEKEEKGGNSSRKEAGGGAVLCGVWKGQLARLQAAITQNYTPHTRKPQTHTEA